MPVQVVGNVPFVTPGEPRQARYAMLVPEVQRAALERAWVAAKDEAARDRKLHDGWVAFLEKRIKATRDAIEDRKKGVLDADTALEKTWLSYQKAAAPTVRVSTTTGLSGRESRRLDDDLAPVTQGSQRAFQEAMKLSTTLDPAGTAGPLDKEAQARRVLQAAIEASKRGATPGDMPALSWRAVQEALNLLEVKAKDLGAKDPEAWAHQRLGEIAAEDPKAADAVRFAQQWATEIADRKAVLAAPRRTVSVTRKDIPPVERPERREADVADLEAELARLMAAREEARKEDGPDLQERAARQYIRFYGGTLLDARRRPSPSRAARRAKAARKPATYKGRIIARALDMARDPEAFARLRGLGEAPEQREKPPWVDVVDRLYEEAKASEDAPVRAVWQELGKEGLDQDALDEARAYLVARAATDRRRPAPGE